MILVKVLATANYNRYVIELSNGEGSNALPFDWIEATRKTVIDTRNRLVEEFSEYDEVEGLPLPELWEMPGPGETRGGGVKP